jgi:DNA-binding protein H-NS
MASRLTTIRAQLAKLQRQAEQLERAASKRIKAAAKVIARYKLSASDLTEALKLSGGDRVAGGRVGRRSPLAGKPVPVKYRDSSGNTWTGRGRPPLWLVAAEKAGKKRESFLVGAKRQGKPAKAKTRATVKTLSPAAIGYSAPQRGKSGLEAANTKARSKRSAKTIAGSSPAADTSET